MQFHSKRGYAGGTGCMHGAHALNGELPGGDQALQGIYSLQNAFSVVHAAGSAHVTHRPDKKCFHG